jgi:hypothetical protein
MSTEIEDLERRVDRLDKTTDLLQSMLELAGMHMEVMNAWRADLASKDRLARQAAFPPDDIAVSNIALRGFEPMLRAVLLRQDLHTADLALAARQLQMLVERDGS